MLPTLRPDGPSARPAETLADVLAEVRRIELAPGRLVTDVLSGGFRSTFRGGGIELADVREYVEGDDPRTVDWNVTARLGRPFVKRFVEERERTIVFVLDLGVRTAAGLGAWSVRQAAARWCACLGLMAIANHDRVGLVAGAATVRRTVLCKRGAGHVLRVVRDCVELPAEREPGDLDVLLARVAARVRRRAVVFVLSDFAADAPPPSLAVCARHHDVVAVRPVPLEEHAPPPVLLRARDPATGRVATVDFANAAVRAAWSHRVQQHAYRLRDELGRAAVDLIELPVPAVADAAAIARPLAAFFRKRTLREARR
jgi:uncharacterized protein (DUF58 family)